MLRKTLTLLSGIPPGTYVPDDQRCYDEAEIDGLAKLLSRLLWSPSQLRKRLQEKGITLIPANLHSPVPTIADVERTFAKSSGPYDYIFSHDRVVAALEDIFPFSDEFDPPLESPESDVFCWKNGSLSYSDAMAYYCFIRRLQPKRIIEIGAGSSTLVADAACKRNGFGEIICIEPSPASLLRHIGSVREIVERRVQELPPSFFNERLADGDILFIDSTHTVKHGSDCLHLYLNVLPHLAPSVFVQVHDVWLPGTRSLGDLRDRHVYWNEEYLVMAYLTDNRRAEVRYGSNYHFLHNRKRLTEFMHGRFPPGGGSLWFSQRGTDTPPDAREDEPSAARSRKAPRSEAGAANIITKAHKFSAYLSIYNDWDILEPALRSIRDRVDELVVVDGAYEWMSPFLNATGRDPVRSDRRVYDAIEAVGLPFRVITDRWKSEVDKRRAGYLACQHRFVYRVDADEILFFNDGFESFMRSGGSVGDMEMPLYVSPGWILGRKENSRIERQCFLFDSKTITADMHLTYLWLVKSLAELPSSAGRPTVFPEPIAFNAHLSHWRTPTTSVNRAAFYVLNYYMTHGVPWIPELSSRAVPDLAQFFERVSPAAFLETLLSNDIVMGHMPVKDAFLRRSPLSEAQESGFAHLYDDFLRAHVACNEDLARSGRHMLDRVQIDLTLPEAIQALNAGSGMACKFSSAPTRGNAAMRYVIPFEPWDVVHPLDCDLRGDKLYLDPLQGSDRFAKFLRRILIVDAAFAEPKRPQRLWVSSRAESGPK